MHRPHPHCKRYVPAPGRTPHGTPSMIVYIRFTFGVIAVIVRLENHVLTSHCRLSYRLAGSDSWRYTCKVIRRRMSDSESEPRPERFTVGNSGDDRTG